MTTADLIAEARETPPRPAATVPAAELDPAGVSRLNPATRAKLARAAVQLQAARNAVTAGAELRGRGDLPPACPRCGEQPRGLDPSAEWFSAHYNRFHPEVHGGGRP